MQTKDRERVNKKTGKVTVVRDSTPIKKGVVVVKEDTAMKQLQRFCDVCKVRWGITPLQIFIYRDEGHYEMPDDETSWKPNYHTMPLWRNWQTHLTQNQAGNSVPVRVRPAAFEKQESVSLSCFLQ